MLTIQHPTIQPTQDTYQIETTIGGLAYVLTTMWDGQSWYMDIAQGETVLAQGQGLRLYWPILLGCTSPLAPAGYFTLISLTSDQSEAGREDLGARCQLVFK